MATKIVDYDLADGPRDLNNLAPYSHVLVLFRWRGKPLGRVRIGVENGGLSQHTLWWTASTNFGYAALPNIMEEIVSDDDNRIDEISKLPTCSVVISTHNRVDDLQRCLDSIFAFTASDIEIIVVDNAPSDDSTARLSANYPVRYIIERRKGASWARTRGAKEASGEVVVYVDDDVVVDNNWVDNLLQPFVRPEVAAVTSLVMPLELETGAQEL